MNKELIDIAIKCGFKAGSFKLAPVVTMHYTGAWVDVTPALAEFAKMVEQATLERAAKHFDDRGKDKHGNWSTGSYDADSPGIILRALKDSHE